MTPENFCYWLQGLMELDNPVKLNAIQTQQIKDHLTLVFIKETPRGLFDYWDKNSVRYDQHAVSC